MKNTEVKVVIAGSNTPVTILIPVSKSAMNSIQSVRSKMKDEIELAYLKGDTAKVETKCYNLACKWEELVRPQIGAALPGINLMFTEANNLLTFGPAEKPKQHWFEITHK